MLMIGLYIHNTSSEVYECKAIKQAADKQNITLIEPWRFQGNNFDDVDFTLNRSYFAKNSALQHGRQINDFYHGIFWKDKKNQIDYLNTYCEKPKTVIDKHANFDALREKLGLPFIAKRSISSQGKGVFMIHNPEEFRSAIDCDIFQEVIWNSVGRDLRIWVLGGEVIGIMQRSSSDGDFRANIHRGGQGNPYDISSELRNVADSIFTQTGLDMMGIDILFGDYGYYFCELNVCPGFHGFDECFGINTADKILLYIKEHI